ncbi:MAG TPA: rhomboid family intramembrane serine protease [Salinarimonas sp.]|jgi:membrane associated rhomboid family serine protease|nr:rhomboid family intramembrane serine protease [Salinarimonas sp.]
MLNLPGAVVALGGLLVLVHVGRGLLSPREDLAWLLDLAFVPARFAVAFGGATPDAVAGALLERGEEGRALLPLAAAVLADGEGRPWTAATYALLHASWAHLGTNVLWLAAFGSPVARRLGAIRFLVLALAAALGGALAQFAAGPLRVEPMIGASGAVSGLMAAAAWFVFAPVPPWAEGRPVHERPRQGPAALLANPRVLAFLAVWLAIDVAVGLLAGPLGIMGGAIAWQAHIGGLLAGLALFPLLDRGPTA